jgi:hypothetical protein
LNAWISAWLARLSSTALASEPLAARSASAARREPLGAGEHRIAQPELDLPGGQPGQPPAPRHGQRARRRYGQPGSGQHPEAGEVMPFQHRTAARSAPEERSHDHGQFRPDSDRKCP